MVKVGKLMETQLVFLKLLSVKSEAAGFVWTTWSNCYSHPVLSTHIFHTFIASALLGSLNTSYWKKQYICCAIFSGEEEMRTCRKEWTVWEIIWVTEQKLFLRKSTQHAKVTANSSLAWKLFKRNLVVVMGRLQCVWQKYAVAGDFSGRSYYYTTRGMGLNSLLSCTKYNQLNLCRHVQMGFKYWNVVSYINTPLSKENWEGGLVQSRHKCAAREPLRMEQGTESGKLLKDWEGKWCWESSGQTAQETGAAEVQDLWELCCPQLLAAQPFLSVLLSQSSLGDAVKFIAAVGSFCSLLFPVSYVIISCFLSPFLFPYLV